MRIPIAELPGPIMERLKAIQANPRAYDCFYKKEPGRGGAIFGLIVVAISLLLLLPFALSQLVFVPVMVIAGILLGAIAFYSVSRIRRFGRAPLRPMMVLNPLYLVRTNLDFVNYHFIWSELADLKITHHYTNGAYTYTAFDFKFKNGTKESVMVSPKKVAEQLADVIETYRKRMLQALENKDYDSFVAHDLFLELREEQATPEREAKARHAVNRRHALAWGWGGAAGALAGFILGGISYASAQSRQVEYCHDVAGCELYFDRWAIPLYKQRAKQQLFDAYKRRWERDRKSARTLREMAKLERVAYLDAPQQKEVLALYREGSQRELRALYQQAIDKYKAVSVGANPTARDSLLKMLELARDKGYYRVRVTYKGVTDKVQTIQPSKATGFRPVVPMGPSFTEDLNHSREALITERIRLAFLTIVPQDILEFPESATRGYPTAAYRALYGSRRFGTARAGRTTATTATTATTSRTRTAAAGGKEENELEFKVGYVVFPSGSIYVSKRDPSKLYVGIGFDWMVRIQVKEQSLYAMRQQSYPPPRFTVTSYGSRYAPPSLGAGEVYAKMATTAFDDFSRNIVAHFGISGGERARRPALAAPVIPTAMENATAPRPAPRRVPVRRSGSSL